MADESTLQRMLAELLEERKEFMEERKEWLRFLKGNSNKSSIESPEQTQATIVAALASRIPKFRFDAETNKTFEGWFARYGDIITNEGAALPEKVRVSLLVDKLEDELYSQLASKVCPKNPKDIGFDEIVQHLNSMFNVKRSLFSWRFACTQITKKEESHTEYTNKVNETCERAQLKEVSVEDWKVFFWIRGLDSQKDSKMRTFFLKFLERKSEAKEAVTIRDLEEEWSKVERQTVDSNQIETKTREVRQVEKNPEQKSKTFTCYNCDKSGHSSRECRSAKAKCSTCSKSGHLDKFCYKKEQSKHKGHKKPNRKAARSVQTEVQAVRQFVKATVEGKDIEFQLDTGADITLLSQKDWKQLGSPVLRPCEVVVRDASHNQMVIDGVFMCKFELKGIKAEGEAYVTRGSCNLLGLAWIQKCPEMVYHLDKLVNQAADDQETNSPVEQVLRSRFSSVFQDGLGKCTKMKAELKIKEDAKPAYRSKRPVPYGALEAVEGELNRLQAMHVIEKISFSKWAAPIVCVRKTTGKIRVCSDFSTGLNTALLDEEHPLPTAEELFSTLNGGQIFSQIDLSDAYLQIELDEQSQELVVINTHKGLFKYKRLPFGVKTAPAIFQRIMDNMISGLPGVGAYLDDIIVTGQSLKEHRENLMRVFQRIDEYGFRVKLDKCSFEKAEIRFLGFILDKDGRRPDPAKVEVIRQMPPPDNLKQLQAFLGLISFYSPFIAKIKTMRGPLDAMLQKGYEWKWAEKEQKCFKQLLEVLSSDVNLAHYDPKLPIIVAADASEYGIGAVISHRLPDGSEKPIYHAARALTSAEKRYGQIEKEALGLIFAVKKFHRYIFGRRFTLLTDHKPLVSIFGSNKGAPVHSQNRLIRWAIILLGYDFEIQYVQTDKFGKVDGLSRLIQKSDLSKDEEVVIALATAEAECKAILNDNVRNLPLKVVDIKLETEKDQTLMELKRINLNGKWPKVVPENLKEFFKRRDELSMVDECLMMGQRVIIPKSLQKRVLADLHSCHIGMAKMKGLARSLVYWPNVDKDCEKVVKNCEKCQLAGSSKPKVPLQPWPEPEKPWQRIHIDFAGPQHGHWFLIAIDAKSKFPEVVIMKTISSMQTVKELEKMFARHGFPEKLVSDNGTQFTSREFQEMCKRNGIEHVTTAPWNPQSNGQAERFVQSLKRSLKKMQNDGDVISESDLNQFLLKYRTTPSELLNGFSPSEIIYGRKLRTTLSLLKPVLEKSENQLTTYQKKMKDQFDKKNGTKSRDFPIGSNVLVKVFTANGWSWSKAKVQKHIGEVHLLVSCEGKERKVHFNQVKMFHSEQTDSPLDVLLDTFELSFPQNSGKGNGSGVLGFSGTSSTTTSSTTPSSRVSPASRQRAAEPVQPVQQAEPVPVPQAEHQPEERRQDQLQDQRPVQPPARRGRRPAVQPAQQPVVDARRSSRVPKPVQRFDPTSYH